jgi:hypothetical protein
MEISGAGKHFNSAQAAQIRAESLRISVLQSGYYKNREEYDLAAAQFPLELVSKLRNFTNVMNYARAILAR